MPLQGTFSPPHTSTAIRQVHNYRFFESLGIDRKLFPHRVYQGAVGKQTRYFSLKLPIAVAAKTATFAYVDPGNDTDTELRSWGAAHQWLWKALRGKVSRFVPS